MRDAAHLSAKGHRRPSRAHVRKMTIEYDATKHRSGWEGWRGHVLKPIMYARAPANAPACRCNYQKTPPSPKLQPDAGVSKLILIWANFQAEPRIGRRGSFGGIVAVRKGLRSELSNPGALHLRTDLLLPPRCFSSMPWWIEEPLQLWVRNL